MKLKVSKIIFNLKFIFVIYMLLAIFAGTQQYLLGPKKFEGGAVLYKKDLRPYTHYNDYIIYKQSFFHLKDGKDLYQYYFDEHADLFKYTPSFALFMGFFAYFPDIIGLCLWNILNALVLFLAIRYVPKLDYRNKCFILYFVIVELMTAMQSSQSNGLMTGLIIFAFGFSERKKFFLASLFIILSMFIKVFGVVAFAMFLFYPKKWKLALYSLLCFVIVFLLPLSVVSFGQLKSIYSSWLSTISHDHSIDYGYSVMGWLKTWFNIVISKNLVVLIGVFLFCLPLARIKQYQNFIFRILTLASVLLWVVIFNHEAESSTFIIAICGAAIWCFSQEMKTENLILIFIALVFTSLSPTDIFPRIVKDRFFLPYLIKAVPCIFIWFKLTCDLIFLKFNPVISKTDKVY